MEYDFKALSDYDFEQLVCDLLSAHQNQRIESFRQGRDQGIDLRYTTADGGKTVVQCKHYAKTPFSGLYAAMKQEYKKIRRLCPEQYVLVTSQFLTPAEKDKLLAVLAPFCQSTEDILGGNELNSLLRRHPEVEQAHYKLWLTSSAVLEKILHSDIYQQSVILQSEIQSKLRLYVQSKTAYEKAHEMLKNFNCCIISGIPGIGKSTLAEILSIYYLDQGYQIIKVRSDIQEAVESYLPHQKQAFIYDDFLGSTALDIKENKNEGKDLLGFLDYISREKGKKLILTTREYILNQARQSSEEFARENFDYRKCIVSLEDYTRSDRARILYNHLFFYDVPREDIQDLLLEDRVIGIIDHPNYSPRLIETVIKLRRTAEDGSFYHFFANILDHPIKLWELAFCRKISSAARDLLLLLCPGRGVTALSTLKNLYTDYHQNKCRIQNQPSQITDFKDALRETEGTFIRIDGSFVSYHNPSVRDFIHSYLRENDVEFKILCETADFDYCTLLAYFDQDLCRKYITEFSAALRKGIATDSSYTLIGQIAGLERINQHLQMDEIRRIIQHMLELLLPKLEQEGRELSEDTWRDGVAPHNFLNLLENFNASDYEPGLADQLFAGILPYALAWFNFAWSYSVDDFRIFPILGHMRSFSVDGDEFQKVYDALADYRDELATDDIQAMDYEGECEEYQEKIERLSLFFSTDLSDIISETDDRIFELEQAGEDDEDDSWIEHSDFVKKLNNREILNMFQGLLEQ